MRPINEPGFLPGLLLENGVLIVDTEKLLYPGDMLHEAGHLATMPPEVRETTSGNLPDTEKNRGGELMALAWSYAACIHLGLDPSVVFHADGYRGGSQSIIENFTEGRYIGVFGLEWRGMAYDKKRAKEFNARPYPHMISWVKEN